ncbi:unnamed protein product [Ranitomeya imitator]|uniref:Uncharacterized protein n=1 Tax=Ranitomeya imitator TaxID=111125 RepID=A0ABN9LPA8_9NEOB|nr:unnamed protein product [Ranitomeya imitator]
MERKEENVKNVQLERKNNVKKWRMKRHRGVGNIKIDKVLYLLLSHCRNAQLMLLWSLKKPYLDKERWRQLKKWRMNKVKKARLKRHLMKTHRVQDTIDAMFMSFKCYIVISKHACHY